MEKRFNIALALALFLLVAAVLISLNIGRYPVTFGDMYRVVMDKAGLKVNVDPLAKQKELVFWNLRLPRVLFAAAVGSALSVSGAVLQALFRNPLASPDIVGVMQGSNFGAALAIFCSASSALVINLSSFIFGLLAVTTAYLLARRSQDNSIAVLVLIGIVISSVFQAGVSLISYFADPFSTLPKITYRLMGSLQAAVWNNIAYAIPLIIVGTLLLTIFSWRLNIMTQSDEEAMALGVNIHRWRLFYLTLSTLLVAASVAVSGNIMWIGLIVPHITRQLVGIEHRRLIPFTAAIGAIFTVIIDTVVRSVTAGEIPISIVTSLIGAPFLGFLVLRRERRVGVCQ